MTKKLLIAAISIYCCSIFLTGCASYQATTAEDFVKKHSDAYASKDAKAVAQMTLCAEDLEQTALPQTIKNEIKNFHRDSLQTELKAELKDGGMWASAWADTKYASEKDQGGYIVVNVKVGYANSSIVLVKVGKYLKIAPNPSSFEQ